MESTDTPSPGPAASTSPMGSSCLEEFSKKRNAPFELDDDDDSNPPKAARRASPFTARFTTNLNSPAPGDGTFSTFHPPTPYYPTSNNIGAEEVWRRHRREGKAFMRLGKFNLARHSFEAAQHDLKLSNSPENTIRRTRLKFQLIIIRILTIHSSYGLLGDEISSLWYIRAFSDMSDSLRDELTIWRAKCYNMRGNYRQAASELRQLDVIKRLETSAETTPTSVLGLGNVRSYSDISGVQAFALTLGYQGLLDRAQNIIRGLVRYVEQNILVPATKTFEGASQSRPNDSDERWLDKCNRVFYTAALIDNLMGDYHSALRLATKAWESQKKRLGERHLQTLDSAALVASLLSLTAQTKKADSICTETLHALEHSDEVSPDRFQTWEAQRVLASIRRQQGRTDEAIATARNAYKTAKRVSLAKTGHPLFRAIVMELANAYCMAGEYTKAMQMADKEVFWGRDVVGESDTQFFEQNTMDDSRHNMYLLEHLHYESQRAHIYGLAGRLDDAEKRAAVVFLLQVRAYRLGRQTLGLGAGFSATSGLEDGIRAVELELDFEDALDMLSEGDNNHGHPAQAEETFSGEKPDTTVPRSDDQVLEKVLIVVLQLPSDTMPSDTRELKQEIRKILANVNTEVTARDRLRARFSKIRIHPWLIESLHNLALIKLERERPPSAVVCRMMEIVQKWRLRVLGESHHLTLAIGHDLARAHRLSGRFLEAKTGFSKVLKMRNEQLGKHHLDSLVTWREYLITSSAMDMPASAWFSPTFAASLEFVGSRPASPTDTNRKTYDFDNDFDPGCEIKRLVRDMKENIGHNHPETLTAQLWLSALYLLGENTIDNFKCRRMFSMEAVGSHLRRDDVVSSRFLWDMKMCMWAARICLDHNRPGHAMELFAHILRRRAQRCMTKANYYTYPGPYTAYTDSVELDEVFRQAKEKVAGIGQKWPLGALQYRKMEESEVCGRSGDSDAYRDLELLEHYLVAMYWGICTKFQDRHRMDFWV